MVSLLKVPDIWRVIREVDLEAIRRDAEARFRVLVLAPSRMEAETAARLLSGEGEAHPWLEARTTEELDEATGDHATVTAAVIVTRFPDLTPELLGLEQRLRRASVPVVTAVHGSTRSVDAVPRAAETSRVVVGALDEQALAPVARALAEAVTPGMRLALARQLPPLREAVFDQLIEETAKANATYAFTAAMAESMPVVGVPLNLADMLILTKNQLLMGYKIAVGSGKSGRARDVVGELLGVIGGGFLFRQAARGLVGLIPVAGVVPKVAIAYTGTWAIGRAVVAWATHGQRLSSSAFGRVSREAAGRGRAFARGLITDRKRSAGA